MPSIQFEDGSRVEICAWKEAFEILKVKPETAPTELSRLISVQVGTATDFIEYYKANHNSIVTQLKEETIPKQIIRYEL